MTENLTQDRPSDSIGRLAEVIGGDPMARIDADMKHVLDALVRLGARALETTTPGSARRQPKFKDAVAAIVLRQNRDLVPDGVEAEDITVDGAEDELPARLYRPLGLLSRLNPVILYFHGGGFVTGTLDSHDATARALARKTGAIVVSADYRKAPEHKFPAAHDDAYAVWRWLVHNARELGGDPRRMAVAGEDAGANLACNIAVKARDEHLTQPIHQLLVHPMAGSDLSRPSHGETLRAQPIGVPAIRWRLRHLLEQPDAATDPRLDLAMREDLAGIAPATIILAQIDPLRSEGKALGETLETAGVPVGVHHYEGVTQGFFGLGLLVTKALFAQTDAAQALTRAFAPGRAS